MDIVCEEPVPQHLVERCTFAPPDYADCFTAVTAQAAGASGEQLARAAVEGASAAGRFLAWEVASGLRLHHGASDTIGGWRIGDRGSRWVRLEANGRYLSAQMVFATGDEAAWFATFVRYDNRVGALVWPRVSAIHRRVAPGFLRDAVRRLAGPATDPS